MIGVYFSGTGNTKHCVETFMRKYDPAGETISIEAENAVQEIAKQYNYRPNSLAQAVAVRKSGILGFCLLHKENPSFAHTFLGPVLDGALQEAQLNGYHLILSANSGSHTFDEAFIQDAIEGVIFSSFAPAEAIRIFQSRKIPRVVINDEFDAEHVGFVLDDSYGGGKLLMEHLIRDCGRRRIAIISDRFSHTSYLLRYLFVLSSILCLCAIPADFLITQFINLLWIIFHQIFSIIK